MFNQLMRLMRRFRRWLTQVWDNLIDWVNPPQKSNPPRLPDHEYEWLFRQLLTQVGQGWNRDQVRRWLRRNEYRVTESRWLEWFPRFHHSAKDLEISRQLLLLKQLDCGAISQIAANLLGETPPKPPLRETNPPPITPPPNNPPTPTDSLPTDAKRWFEDGKQRFFNGDFRGAISSFDQGIKIKPDDHKAWNNRGIALSDLGEYEKALSSYDQALKIKPDDDAAWNNRGIALSDLGEYEKAIYSFDQALKIKPDKHEAWYNRGIALSDLGEYEKAISSYDQAIKFKPDKHEAWNGRGNALCDLGKYEEALSSYDQAIKIKPDKHEAWANRGNAAGRLRSNTAFILPDINSPRLLYKTDITRYKPC